MCDIVEKMSSGMKQYNTNHLKKLAELLNKSSINDTSSFVALKIAIDTTDKEKEIINQLEEEIDVRKEGYKKAKALFGKILDNVDNFNNIEDLENFLRNGNVERVTRPNTQETEVDSHLLEEIIPTVINLRDVTALEIGNRGRGSDDSL